jgi:hypothetical protein
MRCAKRPSAARSRSAKPAVLQTRRRTTPPRASLPGAARPMRHTIGWSSSPLRCVSLRTASFVAGMARTVATASAVVAAELMAQRIAAGHRSPLGGVATEAPRHRQLKASWCAPKASSRECCVNSVCVPRSTESGLAKRSVVEATSAWSSRRALSAAPDRGLYGSVWRVKA